MSSHIREGLVAEPSLAPWMARSDFADQYENEHDNQDEAEKAGRCGTQPAL